MTFTLPDYDQIPNVGLYLEQVTKYLNEYLEPLGCTPLTGSMISNYVKKGLVKNPVKKQYDREHIARLLVIAAFEKPPRGLLPDTMCAVAQKLYLERTFRETEA